MSPSLNDRYLSFKLTSKGYTAELLASLNRSIERGLIDEQSIYVYLNSKDVSSGQTINFFNLNTKVTIEKLLAGLTQWQELGILDNAQINLEIQTKANHPFLLQSLDEWLQLGCIDESKVKQLCQKNLTSILPNVKVSPSPKSVAKPKKEVTAVAKVKTPSRFQQILQSLKAELSVIWLLSLGVFMIVISSGVIAASLWDEFPRAGQYGVLWLYTLLFWVSSFWLGKKPNLQLTTIALQLITLLLVPMNFLAMDSLGLGQNPLDWAIVILATLSLSFVTVNLFRQIGISEKYPKIYLGLSYLHWGWAMNWYPIWAIYLGVLAIAIIIIPPPFLQNKISSTKIDKTKTLLPFNLHGTIVTYALVILLFRAIFIAGVEITQLGLAIGVCGWLLTHTKKSYFPWWQSVGVVLLLLGWLVSVTTVPWQSLGVSCLGMIYLRKRLLQSWSKRNLCLLLAIGLQSLWLLWRLIPETISQQLIVWATTLTASVDTPEVLLSLALFPYILVILFTSEWLVKKNQSKLAIFNDRIAFWFGIVLTLFSLANPALRTINLALSTVTLVTVIQRKLTSTPESLKQSHPAVSQTLATITHISGLITLVFAIDWIAPQLSFGGWGIVFLFLTIIELIFSVVIPVTSIDLLRLLSQNAWYIGLFLAGLSFLFFEVNQQVVLETQTISIDRSSINLEWGLIWCLIPITFTTIAYKYPLRRLISAQLSIITLLSWQLLTLTELFSYFLGREITLNIAVYSASLGIATIVALINTNKIQELAFAVITLGFGLSWLTLHLWAGIFGWGLQFIGSWLLAGAIVSTTFWLSRHRLKKVNSLWADIYSQAFNGWAISIVSITGLAILFYSFVTNFEPLDLSTSIATAILILATAYNSSQKPRSSFDIWLGIATLLTVQIPLFTLAGYRLISLGVATALMVVYVNYLPRLATTVINVGIAIIFVMTCLGELELLARFDSWLLAFASIITILWLLRSWFKSFDGNNKITNIYSKATNRWAIVLFSLQLLLLTVHSIAIHWDITSATTLLILASVITLLAISYRVWQTPTNRGIYVIGWCLEIVTIEVLDLFGYSIIALSIANIILGLITQIFGNWWYKRHGNSQVFASWNIIPLFYAALGGVLRWGIFNNWTGLTSLGLVFILIGVGCRSQKLKPLLYLGIAGISLSAYELLLPRLTGLSIGDRFLAISALTTTFVYSYRVLTPWLSQYWGLTSSELKLIASLHWGLASCLLLLGFVFPVEVNQFVGLGAGVFLTRYAIYQGRNNPNQKNGETWVYMGIFLAITIVLYITDLIDSTFFYRYFAPWCGILVSFGAVGLYLLPWQSWGWQKKPWQRVALILPIIAVVGYGEVVNQISLIAVAVFYGWQGWITKQTRTYLLTLVLIDWVILSWLEIFDLTTPFVYNALLGLSIIAFSWIEPNCQGKSNKSLRNYIRLLGMGIICGTSLLFHYQTGVIPAVVGLVAIFAGLGLRVRAFLYIGTLTFAFNAFYQLVILIFDYPLLKWVVGLIIGLTLLSIAGSFETRKSQLSSLFQNWLAKLQEWE